MENIKIFLHLISKLTGPFLVKCLKYSRNSKHFCVFKKSAANVLNETTEVAEYINRPYKWTLVDIIPTCRWINL